MTFGWLKPVVLLPAGLLTNLSPDEVEMLLAHELAHIRRYDYLANILQTVLETLFFYHPSIHWISAQIRQERENACDDLTLTNEPMKGLAYAKALLYLETARHVDSWLVSAATGANLLLRMQRILGQSTSANRGVSSFLTILCLFLTMVLCAQKAVSQVNPVPLPVNVQATSIGDKLKAIHVKLAVFKDTSINDIAAFMSQKSKEADPEHVGVKFVIEQELPASRKVTMNEFDIPLRDLLIASCDLAKVSFYIDDDADAVVIGPLADKNALCVRTFIVPPTFFSAEKGVEKTLEDMGIPFPPGASATYLPASGKLVVRSTNDDLDLIEALVSLENKKTH